MILQWTGSGEIGGRNKNYAEKIQPNKRSIAPASGAGIGIPPTEYGEYHDDSFPPGRQKCRYFCCFRT